MARGTASPQAGRYQLTEPLGGTALATLYKAYDPVTQRTVAVKVIRSYFAEDTALLQQFFQEVQRIASYRHPGILPILEAAQGQGLPWIAMELLPSGSLKSYMGKVFDLGQAAQIVSQLAATLDFVHEQGNLHRNIKPSNIFLAEDGRVLLADFGMYILAQGAPLLMKTSLTTPLPTYMSPEQIENDTLDRRTDLYSLAILLYEMLTGVPPYYAYEPRTVLSKILLAPPVLPSALNPNLPKALDSIILKALEPDPAKRYRTAGELAQAVMAVVPGEKLTSARPVAATGAKEIPLLASSASLTEDRILCPICGAGNPGYKLYCSSCWGRLRSLPKVSVEEETRHELNRKKARRRNRIFRAISLAITSLLALFAMVIFLALQEPRLAPPSSQISSTSPNGSWAMLHGDPEHSGFLASPAALPAGEMKWTLPTSQPILSTPAVVDGTVYLATGDRRLLALDATAPAIRWQFDTTGPVDSSPAIAGDLLYIGLRDSRLLAIDRHTGQLRWQYTTGNPIYSSPTVDGGVVYVGSGDGKVYALDAMTGQLRWTFSTKGWVLSSLAVHNGILMVGSTDGNIYFLDANNGKARLIYRIVSPVEADPAFAGNLAYIGSANGVVRAVDATIIEKPWDSKLRTVWIQLYIWGMAPPPPPVKGYVWSFKAQKAVTTAPSVDDHTVYVTSSDGRLYALDRFTGEKRWEFKAAGKPVTSPVVVGQAVYFGTEKGDLYALDTKNGGLLWQLPAGTSISTSLATADGSLYFGSREGILYAVK